MPVAQPAKAPRAPRAMVVDDDPIAVELIHFVLERTGWKTISVSSYAGALAALAAAPADLVVVEIGLSEGDGLAFCGCARQLHPGLLLATSRATHAVAQAQALLAGADACLPKPMDAVELDAMLQALQRRRAWRLAEGERDAHAEASDTE
ncbi:MAG: response regulator [Chloroflexi bacterium]|nr:response regulator [Chloroflexota bacterium]